MSHYFGMEMLDLIVELLVAFVCVLYISQRWNEAKKKKFVEDATSPFAGITAIQKKKSAFWYMFR